MILIENATVVKDPLEGRFSDNESVAVENDQIQAVGERAVMRARYPEAERLDGEGCLLLPGLIDAHTHLYAALTSGMPGPSHPPQTFPEILEGVWWRWDKSLRDEDNYISAVVGSILSLSNGITTVIDHHASPGAVMNSLSQVAAGVDAVGMRSCLAYEVSDRDGADCRDQGIEENCRFFHEAEKRKDNRVRSLFGLHAVFSMSDDTLRRCGEAAADLGIGCHMHMAEHKTEVEKFAATHQMSIPEFLNDIGILGSKTLLAHTVHMRSEDISLLRSTGTFNVHNPISNMNNGVGAAPIVEMLDAGQPVGLGSDGFYDLPDELSACRLLQNHTWGNPSASSTIDPLRLVYDHNAHFAERIFGGRFGKVEPGYTSDLILVAYAPFTPILTENLGSHVISALMSGRVTTAIVDGKILLRDGKVVNVDEAEMRARAKKSAREVWDRFIAFQS